MPPCLCGLCLSLASASQWPQPLWPHLFCVLCLCGITFSLASLCGLNLSVVFASLWSQPLSVAASASLCGPSLSSASASLREMAGLCLNSSPWPLPRGASPRGAQGAWPEAGHPAVLCNCVRPRPHTWSRVWLLSLPLICVVCLQRSDILLRLGGWFPRSRPAGEGQRTPPCPLCDALHIFSPLIPLQRRPETCQPR